MIVVVTGASGYLGRAVATELVAAGHDVRTLQRRPSGVDGATDILGSVTDPDAVARALDGAEGIIHLAAKVSLAGDPAEFRAVNVAGTRLVIDEAERAGASRFAQVSSPSVAHAGHALAGVGAEPASPTQARGEYARTKAEASCSRSRVTRRPCASWRCARTWCGAPATRSWSGASSTAHDAGACRCSTAAVP